MTDREQTYASRLAEIHEKSWNLMQRIDKDDYLGFEPDPWTVYRAVGEVALLIHELTEPAA